MGKPITVSVDRMAINILHLYLYKTSSDYSDTDTSIVNFNINGYNEEDILPAILKSLDFRYFETEEDLEHYFDVLGISNIYKRNLPKVREAVSYMYDEF